MRRSVRPDFRVHLEPVNAIINVLGKAPLSVVIVDDSTIIRERLRALVRPRDGAWVVGEAEDADEGRRVIQKTRPDVVLLDIMMPGESGIALLAELKRTGDAPVMVMLTNYPFFRKRSTELGAEYFLNKSTEFDQIPLILRKVAKSASGGTKGAATRDPEEND